MNFQITLPQNIIMEAFHCPQKLHLTAKTDTIWQCSYPSTTRSCEKPYLWSILVKCVFLNVAFQQTYCILTGSRCPDLLTFWKAETLLISLKTYADTASTDTPPWFNRELLQAVYPVHTQSNQKRFHIFIVGQVRDKGIRCTSFSC